jgi:hypothetical protein
LALLNVNFFNGYISQKIKKSFFNYLNNFQISIKGTKNRSTHTNARATQSSLFKEEEAHPRGNSCHATKAQGHQGYVRRARAASEPRRAAGDEGDCQY